MSVFSRDNRDVGLTFTGPRLLVPAWKAHGWFIGRWVGHDCARQPVTCSLEWLVTVDPFEGWVQDIPVQGERPDR